MKNNIKYVGLGMLAATLIAHEVYISLHTEGGGHAQYWWHHVRGFYLVFGMLCCFMIVEVSKWLGHHGLQKQEDYYDNL